MKGSGFFNNALNTFCLRLNGIKHIVKDHSGSKSGNLLPPPHGLLLFISSKQSFYTHHPIERIAHGLLLLISSKGFFYTHHPTERIVHTSHEALAGMREREKERARYREREREIQRYREREREENYVLNKKNCRSSVISNHIYSYCQMKIHFTKCF